MLRQQAGFRTAKAFAEKLNISYNAYLNYEDPNYVNLPNLKYILKIADYFQVSIDDLLERQVHSVIK